MFISLFMLWFMLHSWTIMNIHRRFIDKQIEFICSMNDPWSEFSHCLPSRQVGIFIRAFEKLIRPWPFKGHFTVKIPTCPLNVQEIPKWPMLMRPLKKSQQRSFKFSSQITWWSTFILGPSRSTQRWQVAFIFLNFYFEQIGTVRYFYVRWNACVGSA